MLVYHLHSTYFFKPVLSVSNLPTLSVDVLKENWPLEASTVTSCGTSCSVGMILPYRSTGGLPESVVMHGQPVFTVKRLLMVL